MKNKGYLIAILVIGALGILFGPWLFTRPCIFGWQSMDFTQTGTIGDTIGGITAPIVGFVSILLLWWTLKEQLDFNTKQDKINQEQQKFNDANIILSMETHILHLDDNLHFGYSGFGKSLEGHGVSSLRLLEKGIGDISIAKSELEFVIDRVHVIETALSSMVSFLNQIKISKEEKNASFGMALMYLSYIKSFYENVKSRKIKWLLAIDELDYVIDPSNEMIEKCSVYIEEVKFTIDNCHQIDLE